MIKKNKKDILIRTGSAILALAVWQGISSFSGIKLVIPSPLDVAARLFTLWREPDFLLTLSSSLAKIILGFLIGLAVGMILALIAGKVQIVEILLRPYMVTVKSVPVASFIIIALMIFTSKGITTFISFLMTLPVVYTNILGGMKSIDKKTKELIAIYRLPWYRTLKFIILPHLKPHILSACSLGIGLAFKSGIAAEVIGIPAHSIGEKLYSTKIYFEFCDLFAWTVIVVLISLAFEKLFTACIEIFYKAVESSK